MWLTRWVFPTRAMQVWHKDRVPVPQGVAAVLAIAVVIPIAVILPQIGLPFIGIALIAVGIMDASLGGRDWDGHVSKKRRLGSVGLIAAGIGAIAARIIVW